MAKDKQEQVKFWVVMETCPMDDVVLRQEACVFDNQDNSFCKRPEQIDVSKIWKSLRNSALGGVLMEQYQKEAREEVTKLIAKKKKKR